MTVWNSSRMTTFHPGSDAADTCDCSVKIDDGKILVEYEDDGVVQYVGTEKGQGHFELDCQALSGRASLHRFADSEILEGSWVEGPYQGMWKIRLAAS